MSNIVKSLTFAEGVSVGAPTQTFMTAGAIGVYASTSAFVTAKGSAAASGDVFLNSTDNSIYEYINGAWRSIGPTMSGATTFADTTQSTSKDTGAVIVEGGVGIEKNLYVGGNLVVTGDFTVNGTTTFVNTTNLDVKDANITLNKGGNQASADDVAGLTVEMSDATHAKLLYDKDATSRWKIGDSGSEVEVVTLSHTQSLSNKTLGNTNSATLKDGSFTLQNTSDTSKQAVFSLASITASNTRTFTLPDANTTLVGIATSQTISNKTNDNTNSYTIKDGSLTFQNTADTSKQAVISLASISASTTRTFTLPNATTTLVGIDVAQVLTAKDYDGGTASDTSRFTLSKNSTSNLNALTRKQANLFYDTTTNTLKYDNGTTLVELGTSSIDVTSAKNFAYNGDMGIWQTGTSFASLSSGATYGPEGFLYFTTGGSGVVTMSRSTSVPTVSSSVYNFNYSLDIDVTTADASTAAGERYLLEHVMEGIVFSCIHQKQVTVSFWIYATKTGTSCFWIKNSAVNRSYVAEFTINSSNTWEQKSITVNLDTSGTWLTTEGVIGAYIGWTLMAGSTFQGTTGWQAGNIDCTASQVNHLDSTSNFFRVTGFKVNLGSSATTFTLMRNDPGGELAMCQRYYEKSYAVGTAPGTSLATGFIFANFTDDDVNKYLIYSNQFKVEKCVAPTITTYDYVGNSGKISLYASSLVRTDNNAPGTIYSSTTGMTVQVQATKSGLLYQFTANARL